MHIALLFVLVSAAPLLTERETQALAQEISGDVAKRNLEEIARHHRMRASDGYRAAADHILSELRRFGLDDVEMLRFPADGKIFYGTQRSRPSWNVEFAELWELREGADIRIASWDEMPMRLAQDSENADVTAELIDVGAGTSASDYAGKDVKGKIVLAEAQPGEVAKLAVQQHGALGILSYAQNQRTAWFGENENLVRWGHLDTFAETPAFAFMLSLKEARALRKRLAAAETIRLRAVVRANKRAGHYEIPTAIIRGRSPEEVVYSCHLDHPRPGANDNASGCSAILEIARTFSKLIAEEKLPRPERTIRFVWPPEIEGTMALLVGRPDLARRFRAAIHLDMVGGGPETKAIFHVTRGPASLPSFIYDLGQEIGRWVNAQTAAFAKTGSAAYPLISPTGGKEPLRAELADFTLGSDHQIYSEGSFRIPAIYLNDWPDRYIHTTYDHPGNIDPTKLHRSAFIAAASGWVLVNFDAADVEPMRAIVRRNAMRRAADGRGGESYEADVIDSIAAFNAPPRPPAPAPDRGLYRRNVDLPGPMSVFGYDYLEAHYGVEKTAKLQLTAEQAYEALNLVNGMRTVQEIRDQLAVNYGPVSMAAVAEYLRALEEIGVVTR